MFADNPTLVSEVNRARNAWIESRSDADLRKYRKLWDAIVERARASPWTQNADHPFGFTWSSIADPNDFLYVQCLTYETLNLSAVRVANLFSTIDDKLPTLESDVAAELQTLTHDAIVAIEGWHNLCDEVIASSYVCNTFFWISVENAATACLTLKEFERTGVLTRDMLETAASLATPVVESAMSDKKNLEDYVCVRDSYVRRLRMALLGHLAEHFRCDGDALPLAYACAQEHVRIAKEDVAHRAAAKRVSMISKWTMNMFGMKEPVLVPAEERLKEAVKALERVVFIVSNVKASTSATFSWQLATNQYFNAKT